MSDKKHRHTSAVVNYSAENYRTAIDSGLMQVVITERNGKEVVLGDGRRVTEFINCSYLGLDLHPQVVSAYHSLSPQWGVNFCCARSRFSIAPLENLEQQLSRLWRGQAITFPSVTTTHLTVMPLLASGVLIDADNPPKMRLIFDRFAHSSMSYLKPILAEEAEIETIPHNDLEALKFQVLCAKSKGETPVYIADGIYSMGGLCPINEILELAEELDFYLYIDDAHGTSIFGKRGEGAILSKINGPVPSRLFLAFSLTKGFGVAGGGILLPSLSQEHLVRTYGQIYAFSAPLDFASVNACLAAVQLHKDGTVVKLQKGLRENVEYYDELRGEKLPFSPIRMAEVGNEAAAIDLATRLREEGFFTSVVFFPIVPKGQAQIRVCLAANHTKAQIQSLCSALDRLAAVPSKSRHVAWNYSASSSVVAG